MNLRCAECDQPLVYILETWPNGERAMRAWCVNGERGCTLAGKHVQVEPVEAE